MCGIKITHSEKHESPFTLSDLIYIPIFIYIIYIYFCKLYYFIYKQKCLFSISLNSRLWFCIYIASILYILNMRLFLGLKKETSEN